MQITLGQTIMRHLLIALTSSFLLSAVWGPAPAAGQRPSSPGERSAAQPSPAPRTPREMARQGLKPLSERLPDTRLRPGLLPPDATEGLFDETMTQPPSGRGQPWKPLTYHWAASNLCHRPVYFEDTVLERYGQTYHPVVAPFAAGSRFFLTFPVLPYAMTLSKPHRATSTLGYFRPGSTTPILLQRPPLQADASLVESAAWLGVIFLLP